jgi:hypothetical protein
METAMQDEWFSEHGYIKRNTWLGYEWVHPEVLKGELK